MSRFSPVSHPGVGGEGAGGRPAPGLQGGQVCRGRCDGQI